MIKLKRFVIVFLFIFFIMLFGGQVSYADEPISYCSEHGKTTYLYSRVQWNSQYHRSVYKCSVDGCNSSSSYNVDHFGFTNANGGTCVCGYVSKDHNAYHLNNYVYFAGRTSSSDPTKHLNIWKCSVSGCGSGFDVNPHYEPEDHRGGTHANGGRCQSRMNKDDLGSANTLCNVQYQTHNEYVKQYDNSKHWTDYCDFCGSGTTKVAHNNQHSCSYDHCTYLECSCGYTSGTQNHTNHTISWCSCNYDHCTYSSCSSCTYSAGSKNHTNHSGGTATCKTKATCSTCGQKYGSLGVCSYPETSRSCIKDGATDTKTCSNCNGTKLFDCSHEVTINITAGTGGSVTSTQIKSKPGASNNITAVANSGYTFSSWSTSGSVTIGKESSTTVTPTATSGTVSVTANFTQLPPDTFQVSFNANGGAGSMSSQTFTFGVTKKLTKNAFTRTPGYKFAGWATTASGAVAYGDEAEYSATQNVTLYAKWTPEEYPITYNLDGGTVATANRTSYNIETTTFTLNNPTKTGYTFDGWTGSNGSTKQKTVTITKGSTGAKTYTANYTIIDTSTKYTVYHYEITSSGGYNLLSTQEKIGTKGATITLGNEKSTFAGRTYKDGSLTHGGTKVTTTTLASNGTTKIYLYYTIDTHKITVTQAVGGTISPSEATVNYGGSATFSITPNTNYTIENVIVDGTSVGAKTTYTFSNVTTAHTITAKFKSTVPTKTLEVNNGIASSSGVVPVGTTISLTVAPSSGYRFLNWRWSPSLTLTSGNSSSTSISFTMPNNDQSVTAEFTDKCTVTFNSIDGGTMPSQTFKIGVAQNLSANSFVKQGYKFIGWATTESGAKVYNDQQSITISQDLTLYARWEAIDVNYNIYHYFENAENTSYSLYKSDCNVAKTASTITLSNNKLTTNANEFVYSHGSTTAGGSAVTTTTIKADGTTEIHLYYKRATHTLTLNKNSYISSVSGGGTYKYGASVSINAVLGKADGYTYKWVNWTSSNTSLISNKANPSESFAMPNGSVTLTANGSRSTITYTIKYNLNEGVVSGTNPTEYTIESNDIILINPTKPGHTFTGWTGSNGTNREETVTIPKGSIGNKEYTANWDIVKYTITYDLNGGEASGTNPTNYTIDSAPITLKNPVRVGYTFTGWTGSNGTTPQTKVIIVSGSTGNKSYKANWVKHTRTIVVQQSNGGVISPGTTVVDYNTDLRLTITPNTNASIIDVFVDGEAVGDVSSYEFNNIVEDHSISATFGYSLQVNNGENTMSRLVPQDEEIILTAAPQAGYRFVEWKVSGITLTRDEIKADTIVFTMPTNTVTITANFETISELTWKWSTNSGKVKKIKLKTDGITTIDWGDGTVNNLVKSSEKYEISHEYSRVGDYDVIIKDDVVTYLDISGDNVNSANFENVTSLKELFSYNNNDGEIRVKELNKVVTDKNTNVKGSVNQLIKVEVIGDGSFSVSDDLKIAFKTPIINRVSKITLNGVNTTISNPYDASSLMGTNIIIATIELANNIENFEKVISWDWTAYGVLTKTIQVLALEDTAVLWGDGTYNIITKGTVRNLTHTYSNSGTYKVGIVDASITELDISNSNVVSINVAKATELEKLNVSDNNLDYISLELNTRLTELIGNNNSVERIDLSNLTKMQRIELANNRISELKLCLTSPVEYLDVSSNYLDSLSVTQYENLEELYCSNNYMKSLELGTIGNLKILDASDNELKSLNVVYNTKLEELYCNYNLLPLLNISNNSKLKILKCENNELTGLNVSNLSNLTELRAFNNKFTSLNLLSNTKLELAIVDLASNANINSGKNILRLKAYENGSIDAYDYITSVFIPEIGYKVEKIKLNSVEQPIANSLTLNTNTGDKTLEVWFTIDEQNISPIVNNPNLLDGMIPVKWNGNDWVITIPGDKEWYDYSDQDKKWANIMLRDNAKYINQSGVSTAVGNKPLSELNGMVVDSSSPGSMFVWIPRYTYKITGNNVFVKFSSGVKDYTSDGYILQPAFNFGGYKGGNTSELTNYDPQITSKYMLSGFWVAKYPAVNEGGKVSSKENGTKFIPTNINEAFTKSKEMFENNLGHYGMTSNSNYEYGSHLIKNVEWGAVSYLSMALGSKNIESSTTTGNETGIYGMNSGKEFVSSYIELVGGISNYNVRNVNNGSKLLDYKVTGYTPAVGNERYADKVRLTNAQDASTQNKTRLKDYYGIAINEVTGAKVTNVPNKQQAFFIRGNSTIYDYDASDGSNSDGISFRPTIFANVEKTIRNTYTITASIDTLAPSTVGVSNFGKITPIGNVAVEPGGSRKYVITPNSGIEIIDVIVDGVSVLGKLTTESGNSKSYTFTDVYEDHSIIVIFH